MRSDWLLAFVITPAVSVALGWGAVLLNSWHVRRTERREHTPEL
jgi:hypothetical protein